MDTVKDMLDESESSESDINIGLEIDLYVKNKSSYLYAAKDLFIHSIIFSGGIYLLWFFKYSMMNLVTIPFMSLMTIRTFLIFHDCCHNSYTPNKTLNYILSHITGTFVITSPNWFLGHHTHHITNGHIENDHHYLFNETVPLTKRKFLLKSKKEQQKYMILKKPFVFFGIVPVLYFLITQRYVFALKKYKYPSVYKQSLFQIIMVHIINNVLSAMYLYQLYQYEILPHFFAFLSLGCSLAFMLFHNQHTFNPPYVVKKWSQRDSGLKGSSFIQIPWFLKYFFMGIEYHHIHHMYSHLPGYNLQKYHDKYENDYGFNIIKLSLRECYNNLWLVLYDEDNNKYITFDELRQESMIKYD